MTDLDRYLTDEVVEEAAGAVFDDGFLRYAPERIREEWRAVARAILSAVLPEIIQQVKAEAWDEGRSMSELTWRHVYDGHDCAEGEICPSCGQLNPYREQGGQP